MTTTAPSAGQQRPWESSAFPVRVVRARRVTPGFLRITLAGPALADFAPWELDRRIELVLPMSDGSRPEFGLLDEPTPHPQQWYTRWKELPEGRRNAACAPTRRPRSASRPRKSTWMSISTSRPGPPPTGR